MFRPAIDDSLYNRQRYVLGDAAMLNMAKSSIFLYGLGGVGVEIGKNIVLAGIKSLTIHDTRPVTREHLGVQFFIRSKDIIGQMSRAEASVNQLAALNPYVLVELSHDTFDESFANAPNERLQFLRKFQCVVLTESSDALICRIDRFCRDQSPPIMVISADVLGLVGRVFCDFGTNFEVQDADGEEPPELLLKSVSVVEGQSGASKSLLALEFLPKWRPSFAVGDLLRLGDVRAFNEAFGSEFSAVACRVVTVKSKLEYEVECAVGVGRLPKSGEGGFAKLIKQPIRYQFASFEEQVSKPTLLESDLMKPTLPRELHDAWRLLSAVGGDCSLLPTVAEAMSRASALSLDSSTLNQNAVGHLLRALRTRAQLAPLCAVAGGFAAQQVLIALTGKFSPLRQWLYVSAFELDMQNPSPDPESLASQMAQVDERYRPLVASVGLELTQKLALCRVFMPGCGAIGCELLKNMALLGVASNEMGALYITDYDLIEKSNLNRQFLFRSQHIQKPKSVVAAAAIREMNADVHIEAYQLKVCDETKAQFNAEWFESLSACVNALDNVDARIYMDGRCVEAQVPLVDTGTLGTKGHVQSVVPFASESYAQQHDPDDSRSAIPYCTLKSFPATITHCIEWARDKFEALFSMRPAVYNKFWREYTTDAQLEELFQAKQLLYSLPLDTTDSDGNSFWASPRRPPQPLVFDPANAIHMSFLTSFAKLVAQIFCIPVDNKAMSSDVILKELEGFTLPAFIPKQKRVVTDEKEAAPKSGDGSEDPTSVLDAAALRELAELHTRLKCKGAHELSVLEFEKDDDSNGHMDFIAATAVCLCLYTGCMERRCQAQNLRALMYSIAPAERLQVKKIAGRIIPAIATTTAVIAGLATLELMKQVVRRPLSEARNWFVNLALPSLVSSEPGACERKRIREGLEFSFWDRWEVDGTNAMTIGELLRHLEERYQLRVWSIVCGLRPVFLSGMPAHRNRLKQPVRQHLGAAASDSDPPAANHAATVNAPISAPSRPKRSKRFVDLNVCFEALADDPEPEPFSGPAIRFFY